MAGATEAVVNGAGPIRTPGRKRDAGRDAELCQAALDLLAEVGYDRMTIDAVVGRVGAGKATVYRRWPGKAELVVDAVSRIKPPVVDVDTGTLRGDLVELTCHTALKSTVSCVAGDGGTVDTSETAEATETTGAETPEDPYKTSIMAGLVSAMVHDRQLRAVFDENFLEPRRRILRAAFERAAARGEIPARADFGLLADLFPAMAFHRVMTGSRPPDPAFAVRVIDEVILPLARSEPNVEPDTEPGTDPDAEPDTQISNSATPNQETRLTTP